MSDRLAAIDFGTNTARLLVADKNDDGSFVQIRLEREIVRMGGGFTHDLGISRDAQDRGLSCLSRFGSIMREHGAVQMRAVATSAVRDAVNGEAFVQQVLDETGISLAVIDGKTEGALTLAGVLAGLDQKYNEMILFDIGGGSTEYTLAQGGEAQFIRSLPLGVVRLTEGKVTPYAMQEKIGRELNALLCDMKSAGIKVQNEMTLIGTAGTATTIAAISLEMKDYDYRKVNNTVVTHARIRDLYEQLLPLSLEERLRIPGLEKGREDLIIAGLLITLHTMEMFGIDALKVSDYGLLEGLIVSGGLLDC